MSPSSSSITSIAASIPGIAAPDPAAGSTTPNIPVFGTLPRKKNQSSQMTILGAGAGATSGQRGTNTLVGQP